MAYFGQNNVVAGEYCLEVRVGVFFVVRFVVAIPRVGGDEFRCQILKILRQRKIGIAYVNGAACV